MYQFNEHHPELKGFSKYFHEEIAPLQTPVRTYKWPFGKFSFVLFALGLFGIFVALLLFVFQLPLVFSGLGSCIFLMMIFLVYDMNKYPDDIPTDYVSIMKTASYAGLRFSAEIKSSFLLWRSLGLIPTSDVQNETMFNLEGAYGGIQISLTHLKMYESNDGDDIIQPARVLSFDGLLIRLDMPKSFSGITVVTRDMGKGQPKTKNTLKRVGLADPIFERIFEVYGSDQVESRALLSPDLMQEIVDLEKVMRGKSIEFGFIAGQLLIKLNKPMTDWREAFEAGNYHQYTAQNLIDEIASVFDIVDTITR